MSSSACISKVGFFIFYLVLCGAIEKVSTSWKCCMCLMNIKVRSSQAEDIIAQA